MAERIDRYRLVYKDRPVRGHSTKSILDGSNGGRGSNGKGGRPQGAENLVSKSLKENILYAAALVGADGKGLDGLIGYLKMLAINYPTNYASLLSRILPLQVTGRNDGPVQILSLDPRMLANATPKELEVIEGVLMRQAGPVPKQIEHEADPDDYRKTLQ